MYDIFCPHCDTQWLVGTPSIRSFHNTSEGPIAYVECPKGHLLVRYFRHGSAGGPDVEAAA